MDQGRTSLSEQHLNRNLHQVREWFVGITEWRIFHAEGTISAKALRCEHEPAWSAQGIAGRPVCLVCSEGGRK